MSGPAEEQPGGYHPKQLLFPKWKKILVMEKIRV
jgi:hypothetical protein